MSQLQEEPLSIEALKANLTFAAIQKEEAYHAHKAAIVKYIETETALNKALTKKYHG